MYNALGELQGWVCGACGKPPKDGGMNLVIDHYHFKIHVQRTQNAQKGGWLAGCPDLSPQICWGKTKTEAIARAKDHLLPLSVRGLLCPGRHGKAGHGACNRLMGRVDNVEWLKKVVHYLENPPAKKVLTKYQIFGTMGMETR